MIRNEQETADAENVRLVYFPFLVYYNDERNDKERGKKDKIKRNVKPSFMIIAIKSVIFSKI